MFLDVPHTHIQFCGFDAFFQAIFKHGISKTCFQSQNKPLNIKISHNYASNLHQILYTSTILRKFDA
jgi:hypothetical protein